jgi:hypothetical protein
MTIVINIRRSFVRFFREAIEYRSFTGTYSHVSYAKVLS